MMHGKRREICIVLLCLLIGLGLRLYSFDKKSLWIDEVHTFNDSRDDFKGQLEFYEKNPTYLHPPLFFVLTHQFAPFTKPEKDLRILPLIFGTLSVIVMYFLAKSFSSGIALPCALSLALMTYHISLSQEGRSYSLVMFIGMTGLWFFMKHLKTTRRRYLIFTALFFSALFYTSYTSIPFIAFSQMLWFCKTDEKGKRFISSFALLNVSILLLILPWVLFVMINYKSQPLMDPLHTEGMGQFGDILYGVMSDWFTHLPLVIISALLFLLLPFLLHPKKNGFILLLLLFSPIGSLYLFCHVFHITHFLTSRYFIAFLPLFFISVYLSLGTIEDRFPKLKAVLRLRTAFLILLVASNLMMLPSYYRSEKQDFRGLVTYLKGEVRDGDGIFMRTKAFLPGVLHYFGAGTFQRHYPIIASNDPRKGLEYRLRSSDQAKVVTLYHSENCCAQYLSNEKRLWIVVEKESALLLKKSSPCTFKRVFRGTFASFRRFPTDASMYLFLCDPTSQGAKGTDVPIN